MMVRAGSLQANSHSDGRGMGDDAPAESESDEEDDEDDEGGGRRASTDAGLLFA